MINKLPIYPALIIEYLSENKPLKWPPSKLPKPKNMRAIAILLSLLDSGAGLGSKWDRELDTKPVLKPAKIQIGRISLTLAKNFKN